MLNDPFDRIVVLNLARRPERLEQFRKALDNWPFKWPERFEATDGNDVPIPITWRHGPGAWGCLLSHRRILRDAVADGMTSILVLEDDARPAANFAAKVAAFLHNVPHDWDGLMLGAKHVRPPQPVWTGVVRCTGANLTHAYAVRDRMMTELDQFWRKTAYDHCDTVLASMMTRFHVYAPDPLLFTQAPGPSDIKGYTPICP